MSSRSAAIVKQEADASVVDAMLGAAVGRAIADMRIDEKAAGVNGFIVGNDLHVALHEYRCIGGVLAECVLFSLMEEMGM